MFLFATNYNLYTGVFRNSALGVYWFLDGNENKVDISIVGTNGKFFLINAHGVLRRMGAVTEIPGTSHTGGTIRAYCYGI